MYPAEQFGMRASRIHKLCGDYSLWRWLSAAKQIGSMHLSLTPPSRRCLPVGSVVIPRTLGLGDHTFEYRNPTYEQGLLGSRHAVEGAAGSENGLVS
ncbi:hypothetical protein LshimejAT787_1702340 [Lyophyllum shimeji]|uniref:Uncharacterized protein n=1 Tax=Lyophyllum shimeji TaxID=47721 RepID=A0A9P3UTX0_LYOSH|nr:hypothetical protein LshimejAT787_1702340 [Lyophyllum shimeji]